MPVAQSSPVSLMPPTPRTVPSHRSVTGQSENGSIKIRSRAESSSAAPDAASAALGPRLVDRHRRGLPAVPRRQPCSGPCPRIEPGTVLAGRKLPSKWQSLVERARLRRGGVLRGEFHPGENGPCFRRHQIAVAGQTGAAQHAFAKGAAAGREHHRAGSHQPGAPALAVNSGGPNDASPSPRSSSAG